MARPANTADEHWLHNTVPQGKSAAESVFTGGRPKFPKHLTGLARSEAKRICKLLETRRTLTEGDIATIVLYAETSARWIETKKQVATEGLMIVTKMKDSNGALHDVRRLNPLVKIMQADEAKLLTLSKELGLSPVTRDRVRQTKNKAGGNLTVVPGSVADVMPWLLEGKPAPQTSPETVDLSSMTLEEDQPAATTPEENESRETSN
jgi:P27 family predicted phage terminase small subunit